jgi:hypothetical protein
MTFPKPQPALRHWWRILFCREPVFAVRDHARAQTRLAAVAKPPTGHGDRRRLNGGRRPVVLPWRCKPRAVAAVPDHRLPVGLTTGGAVTSAPTGRLTDPWQMVHTVIGGVTWANPATTPRRTPGRTSSNSQSPCGLVAVPALPTAAAPGAAGQGRALCPWRHVSVATAPA